MESMQLAMTLKVDDSLNNHKVEILADAEAAQKEFYKVKTGHKNLYDNPEMALKDLNERYNKFYVDADAEVKALKARVSGLETSGSSGQAPEKRDGLGHGYKPATSMIPKSFTDKIEDWRSWKEDIDEFLDMSNPGMKMFFGQAP